LRLETANAISDVMMTVNNISQNMTFVAALRVPDV
jgi:hypothetical protein